MANGTQSLDRAAELLSLVVAAEAPLSYTDLVHRTGLARSTTSRLLQALERNGLLERDREGLYLGGALFAQYATRFDRVESLVAASQPMLDRISDETGETVNLAVARGSRIVQVAQVDSTFMLGATSWLDVDVPPHCSAQGKVMFAYDVLRLPGQPMERLTERTVTDPERLAAELVEVRERGYAVTRGEYEDGLDGLAAPLRDGDGHVHAAVGVSGPAFRLEETLESIGALLVTESGRLSGRLARRARTPTTI